MINKTPQKTFTDFITSEEHSELAGLTTPAKIQVFIDRMPYSAEDINRTPLQVLRDRVCHCLDGAVFAALALRLIGFPPVLVDMFPDPGMDDDHVLAIYRVDGCFGALAKSNFTGLRFREPIHRTVRELVISYFEQFFNVNGVKTLRTYTRGLSISQYDSLNWEWEPKGIEAIESRLLTMPRIPLISHQVANKLSSVDQLSYQAGMLGTNPDGLYKPGKSKK